MSTIYSSVSNWNEFVRDATRQVVLFAKMEHFLQFLSYDPKQFFQLVNDGLKECIKPGVKATLDESIWSWLENHFGVLHIDRKPNPDGFRVFMLAFELTRTRR